MSTIAVLGATGIQGGSVVRQLQQNPAWKIRAITRNADGDSAKKLSAQGIEVSQGDIEDVASLEAAFKGATAIFAVTNFWDVPPTGPDSLVEYGRREYGQIINIARAASSISTLKHLVISSLPNPEKISGGKHKVPHMDYKSRAVEDAKAQFPELALKITSLWVGWYATNLALWPPMKPIPYNAVGKYAWLAASKPQGKLPAAGDVAKNIGTVVEKILERRDQTAGKIVPLVVEYPTHAEALRTWSKVTGKEAVFVELTDEAAAELMGPLAIEFGAQLRFSEEHPDWESFEVSNTVTLAQLDLQGSLVGLEGTLRNYPVDTLLG
ncbi:NmrA-like family domain-containing protein [Paramyrothecium foliicola]|nr:NmrA-like family domain-containing protein [Paramyrothecium foliicola]